MKKYARIQGGLVAELLLTEGDIAAMFNPAIAWIDVTSGPAIAEGWRFDGTNFAPPRRRHRLHLRQPLPSCRRRSRQLQPSLQRYRTQPSPEPSSILIA